MSSLPETLKRITTLNGRFTIENGIYYGVVPYNNRLIRFYVKQSGSMNRINSNCLEWNSFHRMFYRKSVSVVSPVPEPKLEIGDSVNIIALIRSSNSIDILKNIIDLTNLNQNVYVLIKDGLLVEFDSLIENITNPALLELEDDEFGRDDNDEEEHFDLLKEMNCNDQTLDILYTLVLLFKRLPDKIKTPYIERITTLTKSILDCPSKLIILDEIDG